MLFLQIIAIINLIIWFEMLAVKSATTQSDRIALIAKINKILTRSYAFQSVPVSQRYDHLVLNAVEMLAC